MRINESEGFGKISTGKEFPLTKIHNEA